MLQDLREHVQGWIAVVIACILCLAFALWGIEYYISGSNTQKAVVKVNGVEITQDQVDAAYKRARQSMQLPDTAANEAMLQQLKLRVLNGLIQEQVLLQAAQKSGYVISPLQIGAFLQQMPAFQWQGQFSPELFQRTLMNLSYTPQTFSNEIEKSMLLQQVRRAAIESNFALPSEVDQEIKLRDQQRDFGYMVIPTARFLSGVTLTDAQIAAYYKANAPRFTTPEQISVQYVVLSTEDMGKKINISDQELQQYYEENKGAFSSPQQWQLARIFISAPKDADAKTQSTAAAKIKDIEAQLESGKAFAQVAMQSSDDKTTAAKGGDLGWVTRMQQPALIQAASLLKPGQISTPFQTDEGWNIIKVMAVKSAQAPPFASVKVEVDKNLRQQKIDQLVSEQSDQLSNLTYTHPDTLKPAADALGLPVQTSELFTRQGGKSGLFANPKIINAAFSDLVLKQHSNSDVISIDDHTVVVLRIADDKPAAVQPLAQVRATIEDTLKQQAAQKAAKDLGMKIMQQLMNKSSSPSQIAKQNQLTWVQKTNVSRQSKEVTASVLNLAFNQPAPAADGKPSLQGADLPEGGCVVIAVNKVTDGVITVDDKQRQLLQQQQSSGWGTLDYDLYVAGQMRKATIKHEQTTPSP